MRKIFYRKLHFSHQQLGTVLLYCT